LTLPDATLRLSPVSLTLAPLALVCLAEVIGCLTGDLVFEGTGAGEPTIQAGPKCRSAPSWKKRGPYGPAIRHKVRKGGWQACALPACSSLGTPEALAAAPSCGANREGGNGAIAFGEAGSTLGAPALASVGADI